MWELGLGPGGVEPTRTETFVTGFICLTQSQHGATEENGERVQEKIDEDDDLLENLATRVFEDESFKERVR